MNTLVIFILLVFGVMGFGSNLLFRVIYVYCEWQEGNEIDWRTQALIAFGMPAAYMIVLTEVMLSTGLIVLP